MRAHQAAARLTRQPCARFSLCEYALRAVDLHGHAAGFLAYTAVDGPFFERNITRKLAVRRKPVGLNRRMELSGGRGAKILN